MSARLELIYQKPMYGILVDTPTGTEKIFTEGSTKESVEKDLIQLRRLLEKMPIEQALEQFRPSFYPSRTVGRSRARKSADC